eukprot:scaffold3461_cov61-Phaeocystis_antarctica.AAC.4
MTCSCTDERLQNAEAVQGSFRTQPRTLWRRSRQQLFGDIAKALGRRGQTSCGPTRTVSGAFCATDDCTFFSCWATAAWSSTCGRGQAGR